MSLPACHREAGSDGRKALLRLAQFEGLRDAARAPAPARPRQAPVSAADDGRWGGRQGWGGEGGLRNALLALALQRPVVPQNPGAVSALAAFAGETRGHEALWRGHWPDEPCGGDGRSRDGDGSRHRGPDSSARLRHRRARRLRVWHVHPVDEGASPKMGATKKSERSPPQRGTGGSMKGFQNSRGKGLA